MVARIRGCIVDSNGSDSEIRGHDEKVASIQSLVVSAKDNATPSGALIIQVDGESIALYEPVYPQSHWKDRRRQIGIGVQTDKTTASVRVAAIVDRNHLEVRKRNASNVEGIFEIISADI
ncbi:hypothetical protein AA313_de0201308 [Arthrobotrys entomopaga]|nr:hypothetical protein AA313_de0201308 [Arthrobotrys entomopaga]